MSDNFDTIKCPACGKEMVKIFVPSAGVNIDICLNGCGGIYFDNREFSKFDEQHENIDQILNAFEGKSFTKVDEDVTRVCPVCGANMVKNYSSIKKEIQVDDCYTCGGKFLDFGELEKIREEYHNDTDRAADTIKFMQSAVGLEIKELEKQAELGINTRSPLKRIFDKLLMNNR